MNNIQKRNLTFYIIGRFVSMIGTGIQSVALPLFILDITGSGALMGIFAALTMVPNILMAPFSGVIGDRRNRRNIMIAMDVGRGILVCLLAFMASIKMVDFAILIIGQVLVSLMDSMFNASTSGMLPDLVPQEEMTKAISASAGIDSISFIIGPALGGVIYGVWGGIQTVFLFNGASFIISGICALFIVYKSHIEVKDKITVKVFKEDIKEAVDFTLKHKALKQLSIFAMLTNLAIMPVIFVVFPYMFRKVIQFTPAQYGYLSTFYMVGILFGNVLLTTVLRNVKTRILMKTGFWVTSTGFIIIALVTFPQVTNFFGGPTWQYFGLYAFIFAFMGTFNGISNTPVMTNLQKMVAPEMRSRFFAVFGMIVTVAIPLGTLLYGFLLGVMPTHMLILALGIVDFVLILIFLSVAVKEVYEPNVAV